MKKNAIVFACDRNFLFTLSVALLSLKENSPLAASSCDIIIFQQGLTDNDAAFLNKIIPCRVIEYKFAVDTNFEHENFKKFTQLTFARYDLFPMLDEYAKALYIDVDLMITGELDYIFRHYGDKSGIAMCKDTQKGLTKITKNFVKPLEGYDMTVDNFNAGVTLYCHNIKNRENLRMWCYEKTAEWLENLVCPDQGVVNILSQEFNIPIEEMPDIFNCTPSNNKYYDKSRDDVAVYHCAGGGVRFWRYSYDSRWEKYYAQYLEMGGEPYVNNDKPWRKFIKKYNLHRFDFFDRSPNPNVHPGRFIKYLLSYPFFYFFYYLPKKRVRND
ncbi:MAG: glycosyltransferase family 8 protein [Deferribacterales bacterium]|nr:glycosyltransferase family 8 protein [Deferribacterales bacterium]